MKSLPLQMQQNLILAATLLGGILLTPPLPTNLLTQSHDRASHGTQIDTSVRSATSFVRRPETASVSSIQLAIYTGEQKSALVRTCPSKPSHAAFIANVPRNLQGEWKATTVESQNEKESTRFEFRPDGHYSYAYSLRQQGYGMVRAVEAITVEEGKVSFLKDGTFVMQPEKGRFQGNIGGGFVNRPMESRELGARTFHWEWRGAKGEQKLYLGPDARSAHSFTEAGEV
jgi:hypothetical protein